MIFNTKRVRGADLLEGDIVVKFSGGKVVDRVRLGKHVPIRGGRACDGVHFTPAGRKTDEADMCFDRYAWNEVVI